LKHSGLHCLFLSLHQMFIQGNFKLIVSHTIAEV
jgi:hypothetical protein